LAISCNTRRPAARHASGLQFFYALVFARIWDFRQVDLRLIAALGMTCVCAPFSALAEPPQVSPAAGSDAVAAMRSEPARELQIQYRKEGGRDEGTYSIGIAADYDYIRTARQLRIHDYKLRRIFTVEGSRTFTNDSLYAEVWYRAVELRNRLNIARALKSSGVGLPDNSAAGSDPFYMESDLGVISPENPRPRLTRNKNNGRISWKYNGNEVVAVRYDKQEVLPAIHASLRRFWPTWVQIHPVIADALTAANRMPAELWVTERTVGKEPVIAHWKLVRAKWESAAKYPLPEQLKAGPALRTGAYPEIFATLNTAVEEKRKPELPSVYANKAKEALDRNQGLEGMLWLLEMNLAQGHPTGQCEDKSETTYCVQIRRAGPLLKKDPRAALAFQGKAPDESERESFDSLPNAYMLHLLWATKQPGKDVPAAESAHGLLEALKTRAIANFCKDTGDFYARSAQPFAAWQAWDFGRLMANHVPDDLLENVDTLETNLQKGEPALF
jgi:hypothetical protein